MDASLEARKTQIKEIRRTLDRARYSEGNYLSLRTNRALSFASLGIVSVLILEWVAEKLGWPRHFIFGFLPLLVGAAGFYWGLRTAKYKSWSAKLYAQLAAYDPVDPISYQKLQEAARENKISYDSVVEWWYMENALVMGPPAPTDDDVFKERFLAKSVETASESNSDGTTNYRHTAAPIDRLSDDPIHRIVLDTRYALESAAERLRPSDDQKGQDVGAIAEALPYVWSGGRDFVDDVSSQKRISHIRILVARYGLDLPATREDALPLLLRLSAHLLDPHPNILLEQLQLRHGLMRSAAK